MITIPAQTPLSEVTLERYPDLFQPGDRALSLSVDREFSLPDAPRFAQTETFPYRFREGLGGELRVFDPINKTRWAETNIQLETSIRRILDGMTPDQSLHVFCMAPHALAARAGALLRKIALDVALTIHQYNRDLGQWEVFTAPLRRLQVSGVNSYFEVVPDTHPGQGGLILTMETPWRASAMALHALTEKTGAGELVRMVARKEKVAANGQARINTIGEAQAVMNEFQVVLGRLSHRRGQPVHLATSSPVAILLAFGRLLQDTVLASFVVHHFDQRSDQYWPMIDALSGRAWAPAIKDWPPGRAQQTRLRQVLERLYTDLDTLKLLAFDAGLERARLRFHQLSMEVAVQEVIEEAVKAGPVCWTNLLNEARFRYPDNPVLRDLLQSG